MRQARTMAMPQVLLMLASVGAVAQTALSQNDERFLQLVGDVGFGGGAADPRVALRDQLLQE